MQRVIIAFNPRSSKHKKIEEEVIRPITKLGGYQVGKYEVKKASVSENAKSLAKILLDGDLLISAGGDGTSTMALNAIMVSGKDVTLGVLGYGNFNDFARMLGEKNYKCLIDDFEKKSVSKIYPMEAVIDGKHWRYAACYFTIGMFAESTEVFNTPKTRGSLKKGRRSLTYSILTLSKWFFGNRKRVFLPESMRLNSILVKKVSDVLFVNSKTVAKIMKGGNCWHSQSDLYVSSGKLRSFWRLVWFMMRSILFHLPGQRISNEAKVEFLEPTEFEIQAEGEYTRVKAEKLVVRKTGQSVKVVHR